MTDPTAGTGAAARGEAVGLQGHYAGGVTRLGAFAVDQFTLVAVFTVVLAGLNFAVGLVTRGEVDLELPPLVLAVSWGVWWMMYFGYSWAVGGRTFGMFLLGIRVVDRSGHTARARQAAIRAATLPLSFALLGLGFLGILLGRERRALHDVLAATVVVYEWDARAAQLRFLARSGPASAA